MRALPGGGSRVWNVALFPGLAYATSIVRTIWGNVSEQFQIVSVFCEPVNRVANLAEIGAVSAMRNAPAAKKGLPRDPGSRIRSGDHRRFCEK